MNFTFKDFGPIVEGNIKTAPLTIICGRNNVGKSYISNIIYACLKNYRSEFISRILMNTMSAENLSNSTPSPGGSFEIDISALLNENNKLNTFSASKIDAFFNSSSSFSNAKVNYSTTVIDEDKIFNSLLQESGETPFNNYVFVKDEKSSTIKVNYIAKPNSNVSDGIHKSIITFEVINCLDIARYSAHIITSERTGIALFQPAIDSLIAHAARDTSVSRNAKRSVSHSTEDIAKAYKISVPVAENMDAMRTGSSSGGFLSSNEEILTVLDQIVGGKIYRDGNRITFKPNNSNVTIPLEIASSSTKSMYLLERYIKTSSQPGDYLIIDEPELNLHIDNQARMAHLIALMVNAGVNVIITTHSDHLLREINGLVMLSHGEIHEEDLSDILNKHKLSKNYILQRDAIAGYVVSSEKKTIYPIENGKYGLSLELFNKEIMSGNTRLRDIQNII